MLQLEPLFNSQKYIDYAQHTHWSISSVGLLPLQANPGKFEICRQDKVVANLAVRPDPFVAWFCRGGPAGTKITRPKMTELCKDTFCQTVIAAVYKGCPCQVHMHTTWEVVQGQIGLDQREEEPFRCIVSTYLGRPA